MNIHWILCPVLLFGGVALYALTVALVRAPVRWVIETISEKGFNELADPTDDNVLAWSLFWPFGLVCVALPCALFLYILVPALYYPGLAGWRLGRWALGDRQLPRAKVIKR